MRKNKTGMKRIVQHPPRRCLKVGEKGRRGEEQKRGVKRLPCHTRTREVQKKGRKKDWGGDLKDDDCRNELKKKSQSEGVRKGRI